MRSQHSDRAIIDSFDQEMADHVTTKSVISGLGSLFFSLSEKDPLKGLPGLNRKGFNLPPKELYDEIAQYNPSNFKRI